jgi:nicotinamide-nucleotide amidase
LRADVSDYYRREVFEELLPLAEQVAAVLRERQQTIAIAESSTGGLLSAALLSLGGASAYFRGGSVIYTRYARDAFLGISDADMQGQGMRASTEPYALLLARRVRERLETDWGVGESGATGPTGNRYGDAAGHVCIAVSSPSRERSITLETASADRLPNMQAFAQAALNLLLESLSP